MTIPDILFYLFGGIAVGTAIAMIVQRNPVMSALLLVGNFFCIASLYLLLHQQFLAVIQIVVYTGAIMVLVIFVIMLLNLGDEQLPGVLGRRRQARMSTKSAGGQAGRLSERLALWQSLGIALVAGLLVEMVYILMFKSRSADYTGMHPEATNLGTVEAIGDAMFNKFLLPFEVTSFLLLVAIIGAVVLAKRRVQ